MISASCSLVASSPKLLSQPKTSPTRLCPCSVPGWTSAPSLHPLISRPSGTKCLSNQGKGDAVGQQAVTSWLDLASFVAKSTSNKTPFDNLADKIGKDCYIDVAGWHLFLKDVRLSPGGSTTLAQGLATNLGAAIQGQGFKDSMVDDLIARVPIKLGQGKMTVALKDVMPSGCVMDLKDICRDWERDI